MITAFKDQTEGSISMLPSVPGAYVLHLHMAEARAVSIGRLGVFAFPAGWHLYVGSAHGPGGLRGRLRHHLAPLVRPHWHVDYLRAVAPCNEVWYAADDAARECVWAAALAQLAGARIIAPRFGASDCGCTGHLISFAQPPSITLFAAQGAPAHFSPSIP
jgi:Uri superfamily endonuclease